MIKATFIAKKVKRGRSTGWSHNRETTDMVHAYIMVPCVKITSEVRPPSKTTSTRLVPSDNFTYKRPPDIQLPKNYDHTLAVPCVVLMVKFHCTHKQDW